MRQIVEGSAKRTTILAGALVIIVACFVAYSPAIRAGFIWDDDAYVTQNPLLTAPDGLYRIWFSTDAPSQYFPLTYTTFWLEHKFWDFNPMGFHVVNIMVHIANALLLWLILRRLLIPGAWFAAAVFALHPVNVESVAWITERKNLLMLLFSLLSVLCWIKFVFDNGRRAYLLYIGSLIFCALALLSKATACMLPAALLLILWLKRSPITAKRLLQIVPYIIMSVGIGLLIMWWEKNNQGTGFVEMRLNTAAKILIAGRAIWFYLWKLFVPVNLTFSYPRWNIAPGDIWQYAWPVASVVMIVIARLFRKRLGRGLVTSILFFLAMLFPMLGFFSLYTFVYSFVADHYQYAACIGPIALVAAGGAVIYGGSGKNARYIILSAAGVLLLALGVLTYRQCRIYKNPEALWQDTLKKNPDSWLAHSQTAGIFFKQGKINEAKSHLEQAIELAGYLKEIHPRAYADFYVNLSLIAQTQGKLDEAAGDYDKSLEVFEYSALVHYRLAEILVKQGKNEEALTHYRRALEIAQAKGADNLANEIRRRIAAVEGQK
jgi:hypothetical protein